MTLLSRILAFFPFLHGLSVMALVLAAALSASSHDFSQAVLLGSISVGALYLLPPALFRIHNLAFPLEEGFTRIDSQSGKSKYSPWWGGHQLQGLFIAFPALESILRLIPGAYSAWLRLWGAKVGRGVYWTPRADILDRSLLEIGDGVIFGHDVALCSHVVITKRAPGRDKKHDSIRLYVKKISIGSHCLIGAQSKIGPGVQIADRTDLEYGRLGKVNEVIGFEIEVSANE